MKTLLFVIIALILIGLLGGCTATKLSEMCGKFGLDTEFVDVSDVQYRNPNEGKTTIEFRCIPKPRRDF